MLHLRKPTSTGLAPQKVTNVMSLQDTRGDGDAGPASLFSPARKRFSSRPSLRTPKRAAAAMPRATRAAVAKGEVAAEERRTVLAPAAAAAEEAAIADSNALQRPIGVFSARDGHATHQDTTAGLTDVVLPPVNAPHNRARRRDDPSHPKRPPREPHVAQRAAADLAPLDVRLIPVQNRLATTCPAGFWTARTGAEESKRGSAVRNRKDTRPRHAGLAPPA